MESEIQLLNAAGQMNKEALVKIFDNYASPLYKYAILAGSDPIMADRIVGDVFCKLVEQLTGGNAPAANLKSYLFGSTYRRIMGESSTSQSKNSLDDTGSIQGQLDPLPMGIEKQTALDVLLRAIQTNLTDSQRHVILLRFCEGFSVKETAVILGKPVNIIEAAQNQAVETLRRTVSQ